MARLTKRDRIMQGIWAGVRHMIEPELTRYRARYPHSRRLVVLEAMFAAAQREDEVALIAAGNSYFRLTRVVPPGCYAVCPTRSQSHYLSGERISGRLKREQWTICRFSPQVWR